MNHFIPTTGAKADWNAAYFRLEDYFQTLGVIDKVQQNRIIVHILEKAAARHAADAGQNPTTLAMEEARAVMQQWFENILGERERIMVAGLTSLLAVDVPEKWPAAFLSDEIPAELRREMRANDVRTGPGLRMSRMVPQSLNVRPLLDPLRFPDAVEMVRWSLAVLATVVVLAVLSVSRFIFAR
jgi:hypothetical protein